MVEEGEGTVSIHRGMGSWDSLQWLLFWALSLGAEEDIPACSAASDHQALPCLVSAHKSPERQDALRGQHPHELLRKGILLAMAGASLGLQEVVVGLWKMICFAEWHKW